MPSATLPAPFGAIRIDCDETGTVTGVAPRARRADRHVDPAVPSEVVAAFDAYLQDGRVHPVCRATVPRDGFVGRVLDAMQRIPPGEVRTYGELAALAGSPRAARAVGAACAANPLPILVPCHRVVGVHGLGGYSGGGLGVKTWLLAHEGVDVARWTAAVTA